MSLLEEAGRRLHWRCVRQSEQGCLWIVQVEPRVGGKFSIFGDSVEATFTALQEPSCIALDWRFKSWPDGAVSKVGAESVTICSD